MLTLLASNLPKNKHLIKCCATIILAVFFLGCGERAECSSRIQSTIKGMKIENVRVINDECFHLSTTGALFEINKNTGTITIYQSLGKKRKLAEVHVSKDFASTLKVNPSNEGFEYVWCENNKIAKIIISGDSVVRFYNVKKLKIRLTFTPIHHKINPKNNGLIALDNAGGIAIMPPDNISAEYFGVSVENDVWHLDSHSKMSVLFIGVCPPRKFDWERSKWPIVHYSSHIERYPSDKQIREYGKFAKVLEMHQWVWKNRYINKKVWGNRHVKKNSLKESYNNCNNGITPLWRDGASWPEDNRWIADDKNELKRVVATAHAYGMLVAVYFNGVKMDCHSILPEARRLKKEYSIDGIYLDGLLNRSNQGPLDAYLTGRELRILFGDNGWLNFHNTHYGYFSPFIQTYMDFVTTGEHKEFDKFTSTTFNISNAIGGYWPEIPFFWPNDSKNIKDARPFLKNLVDLSLKYHNRLLFLTGKRGQWRFWRLYFTPQETKFMKDYYLKKLIRN